MIMNWFVVVVVSEGRGRPPSLGGGVDAFGDEERNGVGEGG